jgi:hypothetical protein
MGRERAWSKRVARPYPFFADVPRNKHPSPTHLKPSLSDRIPDGFGGLDQAARHNQEGHGVGRHLLCILRHGPQIWRGAVALGGAVGVGEGVTVCLFSGCCALGTRPVAAGFGFNRQPPPPVPHPALTHNLCV